MKHYPRIRYPSDEECEGIFDTGELIIEEKADGGNFRMKLIDGEIIFGSRNLWGEDMKKNQFEDVIEYIEKRIKPKDVKEIEDDYGNVTFFGEAMIPHTIEYNWEETPLFIGFDVWSDDKNVFLDRESVEDIYNRLGFEVVPLIDKINAEEWDDYEFEVPESKYYDGKAEGVVFKNHTLGIYSKYKTEEFSEKNKEKYGPPSKKELDGTEQMLYNYVTENRVKKIVHKLLDEGKYNSIKMEMMEDLPKKVLDDVAEEDSKEIIKKKKYEVNLGLFRKKLTSRCASILKKMVQKEIAKKVRG